MKRLLVSVALAPFALAATAAAQSPLVVIEGVEDSPYEGFGHAVASAGDLDGDGAEDLVVGCPYEGLPDYHGLAHVYSGATGEPLLGALNAGLGQFWGHFGMSVAGVGDVNGDSVPDVAVGEPQIGGPSSGGRGAVSIFSGADGSLIHRRLGDGVDDQLGWAVTGVGDIDLDGVPDWAAGAAEDFDFNAGSGYARFYSGATGNTIRTIRAGGVNSRYGQDVCGAGDVNFDGVPDVLIGACGGTGFVQMRSGLTGGSLWQRVGSGTFASFGWDIDRAGDVNGNGVVDFLVGSPGTASVKILRGDTGGVVRTITGQLDSNFGVAVTGLGDLDLDGSPDFAIGAKWYDGAQNNIGGAFLYSGAEAALLRVIRGQLPGDRVGSSLTSLGDVNGDGYGDLAIGAPQENSEPGFVRIDSGHVRPHTQRRP